MTFKYYPRYASLAILIVFNIYITVTSKSDDYFYVIFYLISLVIVVMLFSVKYVVNKGEIIKYVTFFSARTIKIYDIRKIEIVNVKKIGTIEIYIGKAAKAVKEDGYYLIMKDDELIKIDSGYRNNKGITLGKYLINNYNIRNKYIEKYKLFHNNL